MSFGLSFFVLCVAAPAVFAFAKVQAYLVAGFFNLSAFGFAKGTESLKRWAIFRRHNYVWYIPSLLSAFFIESGQSYSSLSPEGFLLCITFVATPVGICRTLRDVLERRYGHSSVRERNARIYATLITVGVVLFFLFKELS